MSDTETPTEDVQHDEWEVMSPKQKEELRLGLEVAKDLRSFEKGDRITIEFDGDSLTGTIAVIQNDVGADYRYPLEEAYEVAAMIYLPDSEQAKLFKHADELDSDGAELAIHGQSERFTDCLILNHPAELDTGETVPSENLGRVQSVSRPDDDTEAEVGEVEQ